MAPPWTNDAARVLAFGVERPGGDGAFERPADAGDADGLVDDVEGLGLVDDHLGKPPGHRQQGRPGLGADDPVDEQMA
jgi:hypothetical protein